MQISDVKMWGRDYSAREWTPEQFDEYERTHPGERPVQFLRRYIGYPGNTKCISAYNGMYRRHWEAGRPVGLFHQIGYTDMEGGYDRGRQHALAARVDAESARVGWRGESHIVACMDRFYAKAGYRTLNAGDLSEYMRGFRSVLGDRTGFYGFFDSMRDAINGGWASYYVQCGARSAHVPGIHEWQDNNYQPLINGVGTDILELYASPQYAFNIKAPGGGGVPKMEDNDVTIYVRRVSDPTVKAVTSNADGYWGRELAGNEWDVLVEDAKQQGRTMKATVLEHDWDYDAIPKRSGTGQQVWNYLVPTTPGENPKEYAAGHQVLAGINVRALLADVDEAELAEELEKRGMGGMDIPQLKKAMSEVLGRVRTTVSVDPEPEAAP